MFAAILPIPDSLTAKLRSFQIELQFALATALAAFSGLIARDGTPGSIAALVPLVIFLALAFRQKDWNGVAIFLAVLCIAECAAVLIEPGPINLTMVWVCLAVFALNRRGHAVGNLAGTLAAIAARLFSSPQLVLRDVKLFKQAGRLKPGRSAIVNWRLAVLPVVAGTIFAILLAAANPIIDAMLNSMAISRFFEFLWTWAPLVTAATLLLIWSLFRMRPRRSMPAVEVEQPAPMWHRQYFSAGAVAVTLTILNAMFLAENGLDFSYIWSGSTFPPGVTYASYVHRGAYTLIVTALMAGALMILALWPGSRTEASKTVRRLVYLWVAQNVMLVTSSVSRTLSYIDAYGMTLLRLSGLIWMALVATGLLLIAARVVLKRSNLWLLNRNIAATFVVLLASAFIDFRAIVAGYNVDRAFSRAARFDERPILYLDVKYLSELGPSSIPSLRRIARATMNGNSPWIEHRRMIEAEFPARRLLSDLLRGIEKNQNDWRHWTVRGLWLEQSGTISNAGWR